MNKAELVRLHKRISIHNFQSTQGGTEQAWTLTPEAKKLFEQEEALLLESKIATEQGERVRVSPREPMKVIGRAFIKLFSMSMGVGGQGRRDTGVRSKFKAQLVEDYKATHKNKDRTGILWCCVTGEFFDANVVTAAHLFPYRYGTDVMDAIFGREDPDASEMFSTLNGLLIYSKVEQKLDRGDIIIVPDLPDLASKSQVKEWHAKPIKEYKTRVLATDASMNEYIPKTNLRYRDLDERPLQFRSDTRPRARYLYFLYCMAMIRQAWATRSTEALKQNIGRQYWGTRGRYIQHGQLQEIVKEMGEDLEFLMEGAMEEGRSPDSDSKSLLLLASNLVTEDRKADNDLDEEDSDDDE